VTVSPNRSVPAIAACREGVGKIASAGVTETCTASNNQTIGQASPQEQGGPPHGGLAGEYADHRARSGSALPGLAPSRLCAPQPACRTPSPHPADLVKPGHYAGPVVASTGPVKNHSPPTKTSGRGVMACVDYTSRRTQSSRPPRRAGPAIRGRLAHSGQELKP
jgi:hypothetical protein